jgi:hypothetical protein
MKNRHLLVVLALSLLVFFSCYEYQETATEKSNKNNEAIAQSAAAAYPTPLVKNFIERKTVKEWVNRWDTPMIITYVYLFANNNCIGYFVCDGKPASTMSYLEPEEKYYMNGATLQTPSLDGTYGSDQPGWIFFTSEGTAVSWQGGTANVLFSDAQLPALSNVMLGKLQAR